MTENIEDITENEELNNRILEHPSSAEGNPEYWMRLQEYPILDLYSPTKDKAVIDRLQ